MQEHKQTREQLAEGAAYVDRVDDDGPPTVRVIPIREGERVRGFRPDSEDEAPAIWDAEPLKEAIEQNRLRDALRDRPTRLVKGEGGTNPHFPIEEQVPPENILAEIDRWEYEDGVGPVGYAQLADEAIADRIDLGLLDISGDWLRRLGEYDAERGGKPVEEVVALPRITVLDSGASSASIEPAEAEALGYNPEAEPGMQELHQYENRTPQSDDAVRWQSEAGGEREPADTRYGVVVNPLEDDDEDKVLVSIYQATADYDGWENRTDDEERMSVDTLEVVGTDGKASLPPISQVFDTEQNALARIGQQVSALRDEMSSVREQLATAVAGRGDPGAASDTEGNGEQQAADPAESGRDDDTPTQTMGDEDNPNTDLREQLAEYQTRVADLEDKREQLAAKRDSLEEQLAEKKSAVEEKDDKIDDLESEVEQLAPLHDALAEAAADQGPMSAEQYSERFTAEELLDALGGDADDPVAAVKEQFAAGVAPRGDGDGGGGGRSEEEQQEVEQLASSAMNVSDMRAASEEGIEYSEYLAREYDVDPAEYGSSDALRQAMRQGNGGEA